MTTTAGDRANDAITVSVEARLPEHASTEAAHREHGVAVAKGLGDLMDRLGIPGRPDVTVSYESGEPTLTIAGRVLPRSVSAELAAAVGDVDDPVRLDIWSAATASRWPATLLTAEAADRVWRREGSADPAPPWWMSMLRHVVRLGASLDEPDVLREAALRSASSADGHPAVAAESVARRQTRPIRILGQKQVLSRIIGAEDAEEDQQDFDRVLRSELGPLRAFMPGLAYRSDPEAPEDSVTISIGALPLFAIDMPDPGMTWIRPWLVSADEEGYVGPTPRTPPGLWDAVEQGSVAEAVARTAYGATRHDYLVTITASALWSVAELLADERSMQTLFDDLLSHVGAAHTVWFTRQVLTDAQIMVAIRALLGDGGSITELAPYLRELLTSLDLSASDAGFTQALQKARGRWLWQRQAVGDSAREVLQAQLSPAFEQALLSEAEQWDETLPATGAAADALRQQFGAFATQATTVAVAPELRGYAAMALRGVGIAVLSDGDLPRPVSVRDAGVVHLPDTRV